ncbi:hypothetical protein C4D60_Mb00t02280 [Musa balbisiana]|uniref:Uncharacterized protein n=1 Tax=Musa balbisiana TaxID=52838 RepID=A0A4S8I2H7_MUSBA|nr:hypothetical protein C4D60_Mb00t02280 [Musa balbisiana]
MSASRRNASFRFGSYIGSSLDKFAGAQGPGTTQVRRTPEVTAMSRNGTNRLNVSKHSNVRARDHPSKE